VFRPQSPWTHFGTVAIMDARCMQAATVKSTGRNAIGTEAVRTAEEKAYARARYRRPVLQPPAKGFARPGFRGDPGSRTVSGLRACSFRNIAVLSRLRAGGDDYLGRSRENTQVSGRARHSRSRRL